MGIMKMHHISFHKGVCDTETRIQIHCLNITRLSVKINCIPGENVVTSQIIQIGPLYTNTNKNSMRGNSV